MVCSFNNLAAVTSHLLSLGEDAQILCAGSNGMFCMEDTVCAGKLIENLIERGKQIEITDAGKASLELYKVFGNDILKMLQEAEHGKVLMGNDFGDDLSICASVDSSSILPVFNNGVIKALNQESGKSK